MLSERLKHIHEFVCGERKNLVFIVPLILGKIFCLDSAHHFVYVSQDLLIALTCQPLDRSIAHAKF